ncbi:MAG TPA: hypothetical protein VEU31_04785 [Candidatus Acidoferrales bacterium]|nr:hypothetical protein [Candidatus Acidoferrales bacterium]
MNRILYALLVLLCFELGVLLLLLPWFGLWEQNYFLNRFPSLVHVMLNPAVRGAVSGLGLLDIAVAVSMVRRRWTSDVVSHN